ncbi:MAG: hypothetical protein QOC81_2015 [Thermoanaerobaculia bacterium]|nr:hypothetical protein [Thermoanaerobaculia bacterium]
MTHNRLRYVILTIVVAMASNAFASEPVDCFYSSRAALKDKHSEFSLHRRCATVQPDGSILILPEHLRALDFHSDGLATLALKPGGWFYVRPNGKSLEVLTYDNGPDYFVEGVVRGRRNGKIAFFDRSFRMVLPPKYAFAWPFENGLAAVCSGCKEEPPSASDPEHHAALAGGLWGYIDHRGNEVVSVRFSRDEAARRRAQLPRH